MDPPTGGGSIRVSPRQRGVAFMERLRAQDKILVAKGWVPISPWWWRVLDDAYIRGKIHEVLRGGRRGGKSSTLCRVAVCEATDTAHEVPEGDVGLFAFLSAEKGQAKARLRTCAKILDALEVAAHPTAETIWLTDRNIGIQAITASLSGVVSFTCIGAVLDEMARWRDPDSGANPAKEVISSLTPTISTMPYAKIWYVSAPWSTTDEHHKMCEVGTNEDQNYFCGTSLEMNPTLTAERIRQLEPDEESRNREYYVIPMSSDETKFFPAFFVDLAAKNRLEFKQERTAGGGDFAFRRNSAAVVAIDKKEDLLRLCYAAERVPGREALKPSITIKELVGEAVFCGADSLACDLHYVETVREHIDVPLIEFPSDPKSIDACYVALRVFLSDERIDLSEAPPLMIEQLKQTTQKPEGVSLGIKNPTKGKAHGDWVSALVAAVFAADLDEELKDDSFGGPRPFGRGPGVTENEFEELPSGRWVD